MSEEDDHRASVLGVALRLAHVLSGGVPGLLDKAPLTLKSGTLTMTLSPNKNLFFSDAVDRLFKALAKSLNVKPKIK